MNKKANITLSDDELKYIIKYNGILSFFIKFVSIITGTTFMALGKMYITHYQLNPISWVPFVVLLILWLVGCEVLTIFILCKIENKRTYDVFKKKVDEMNLSTASSEKYQA